MKNKVINYVRNVWEWVCLMLLRIDVFWYKYVNMEETFG